ncbi:MAG: hypothetical protein LBG91_02400 [Treponema sp.]|jgi:hypothetical protein|nr:hypothetical protein [Treponema sp.]
MTHEIAIIIAAGINAFFIIAGIVLTQFFNYRQRKLDFEEELFMEAHQKKLAVYEDAIKELQAMSAPDIKKICTISSIEMSKTILDKLHILDGLLARLVLFGSPDSVQVFRTLRCFILQLHEKCLAVLSVIKEASDIAVAFRGLPVKDGVEDIAVAFNDIVETSLRGFTIIASDETSPKAPFKKPAGKKLRKKPKGNNNDPIIKNHFAEGHSVKRQG